MFTVEGSVVEGKWHATLPKFRLQSFQVCIVETPSEILSIMNQ